jgi:hypothetical protein
MLHWRARDWNNKNGARQDLEHNLRGQSSTLQKFEAVEKGWEGPRVDKERQ